MNNNLQRESATYTRNKEFGLVTGQIEVMAAVSQLLTRAGAGVRPAWNTYGKSPRLTHNAVSFDVPGCNEIPIPTQMATPLGLILCEALAASAQRTDGKLSARESRGQMISISFMLTSTVKGPPSVVKGMPMMVAPFGQ